MALVPTLDRLTRKDAEIYNEPIRGMAIWQDLCEATEGAFGEIVELLLTVATKNGVSVQTTAPTGASVNDLWFDSDDGFKAYSWDGAAWIAVQDIGAAYARVGINPDGTIANDKVVNASVLAGEVLGAQAGYTAGTTNISSGGYTYTQVASQGFTSSGGQVRISCAAIIDVIDNCKFKYRLKCDGSVVGDEVGPITVSTADQAPLAFTWAHTPSAAAHTYTLEVACNDAGDINVINPLIDPFENRNL